MELWNKFNLIINIKDTYGDTPLICASIGDNLDVVKFLLEKGADIEAKDTYGNTPLILASVYNRFEIIKLLLEKGANIEAKNNYGGTFLSYISKEKKRDKIEEIIQDIKSRKMMVKPCRKR